MELYEPVGVSKAAWTSVAIRVSCSTQKVNLSFVTASTVHLSLVSLNFLPSQLGAVILLMLFPEGHA